MTLLSLHTLPLFFFFFSSRRRHTRYWRDWSSDVCSSDLHLRKLGAADPLDEISGSTGLSGGADGVLVLKRDRGRADAYLHVTGREIEEEVELALRWDANLASWSLVGDADEYRLSNERQHVLQTLRR